MLLRGGKITAHSKAHYYNCDQWLIVRTNTVINRASFESFFSVQWNWIYIAGLYYYREEMRWKFEMILRIILIPNKIYLKEHGTFIIQLFSLC